MAINHENFFSRCFFWSAKYFHSTIFFVTFGCCFLLALLSIFHLFASFLPKVLTLTATTTMLCYHITTDCCYCHWRRFYFWWIFVSNHLNKKTLESFLSWCDLKIFMKHHQKTRNLYYFASNVDENLLLKKLCFRALVSDLKLFFFMFLEVWKDLMNILLQSSLWVIIIHKPICYKTTSSKLVKPQQTFAVPVAFLKGMLHLSMDFFWIVYEVAFFVYIETHWRRQIYLKVRIFNY